MHRPCRSLCAVDAVLAATAACVATFLTSAPAGTAADISRPGFELASFELGVPATALARAEPPEDIRILRFARNDAAPRRPAYSQAEAMPTPGAAHHFQLSEPYRGLALAFAVRATETAEAPAIQTTFARTSDPTRAIALARAPQTRPKHGSPRALAKAEGRQMLGASAVLAYAPPTSALEAPFDALIDDTPENAPTATGGPGFVPRTRPDPATVLTWLEGRALGQFAPGQHAWVQNHLPAGVHSLKEQKCLAEGIYFEARGEPELGQAAVAQVILNRVRAASYPDTICGVVYQNKSWRNRCQFSFACDGRTDKVRSPKHWRTAQRIARDVTNGKIWLGDVGDSTHYYADYVRPRWARRMIKMETIGAHLFYRTKKGGWS